MTTLEAEKFLDYLAGGWPSQEVTDQAVTFWSRHLRDVSLADALEAIDALVVAGQVHYPRPAEVLARCPAPMDPRYGRYGALRRKAQGEWDREGRGYRRDGTLTPAERRELTELTRHLGATL